MKPLARLEVTHGLPSGHTLDLMCHLNYRLVVEKYFFSMHALSSYLQEERILNHVQVPQPTLHVRLSSLISKQIKNQQSKKESHATYNLTW